MFEKARVSFETLGEEEVKNKIVKKDKKRYSGDYNQETLDFLKGFYPEEEYRFRHNPGSFIAIAILHRMMKTNSTIFSLKDVREEGLKDILDEYLKYVKEREALYRAAELEEIEGYTVEQCKAENSEYIKNLYNTFLKLHIPMFIFGEDAKLILVAYTHMLLGAVEEFIGYFDDKIYKFNIKRLEFLQKVFYLALKYMIAERSENFVSIDDEKEWIYIIAPILEGQTLAEINEYENFSSLFETMADIDIETEEI